MNLLAWITGKLSRRGRILLLYRQGMVKAKLHRHRAAIDDYTAIVEMAEAGDELKAMAIYNRSLVWTALNDTVRALADLDTLLEMPGAPASVRTAARHKLVRLRRAAERHQ